MLYHPSRAERLATIAARVSEASQATDGLMSAVMKEAYAESSNVSEHIPAQMTKLISARAWTDTGLALISNRLPKWKLRRLVYDEGQWHCALSLQPEFPDWLDEAIETNHSDLSLAILKGCVEALSQSPPRSGATRVPTVPRVRLTRDEMICCDNFA
jgi:hypothetical protein